MTKITELVRVLTAADVVDEADIVFGVDDADLLNSARFSLAELKKAQSVKVYATVAVMSAATGLKDGDILITRGYTTAGIGAGTYRFVAGDATAADGGFVITHASGRIHLDDKSVARVDQFGATPGGADTATFAQLCVNALGAKGGTVEFPIGDWHWNSTVTIKDKGPIEFRGYSPQSIDRADNTSQSRITLLAGFTPTTAVFAVRSSTAPVNGAGHVTFRNLICRPLVGVKGIFCHFYKDVGDLTFWGDVHFDSCVVHFCSRGLHFEDPNGAGEGFGFISVDHSTIEACTYGISATCQLNNTVIRDSIIRQCTQSSNSSYFTRTGGGIVLSNVANLVVSGCDLEGSQVGVQALGSGILIQGNYFEANFDAAVVINASQGVNVADNHFPANSSGLETHLVVSNSVEVTMTNNGSAKAIICGTQNRNVVSDRMDLAEFSATGSQTLTGSAVVMYSVPFAQRWFSRNSRWSVHKQSAPWQSSMTVGALPTGILNERGEANGAVKLESAGGGYFGLQYHDVPVKAGELVTSVIALHVPSSNTRVQPIYVELRLGGAGVVDATDVAFSSEVREFPADEWNLIYGFMKTAPAKTFTAAADDVIMCVAHGFTDNQPVQFDSTITLPAPLAKRTVYYVRDKTNDNFKLALTVGGAAVDITGTGTGTHSIVTFAPFHNWRLYQLTSGDVQYLSSSVCGYGKVPIYPEWRERHTGATERFTTDGNIAYGSAAPAATIVPWVVGQEVRSTAPAAAGFVGWICTTAGTPGTWKTFGAITA